MSKSIIEQTSSYIKSTITAEQMESKKFKPAYDLETVVLKLQDIRDKYCSWGEIQIMNEAIDIIQKFEEIEKNRKESER